MVCLHKLKHTATTTWNNIPTSRSLQLCLDLGYTEDSHLIILYLIRSKQQVLLLIDDPGHYLVILLENQFSNAPASIIIFDELAFQYDIVNVIFSINGPFKEKKFTLKINPIAPHIMNLGGCDLV